MKESNIKTFFGNSLFIAIFIFGLVFPCVGQEFQTPSGSTVIIDQNTSDYRMENILSDSPTIIVYPKEGQSIGKAIIKNGTETTTFIAKKITFTYTQEDFILEENAKIEWAEGTLSGPVKIEFFSKKETMIITGSKQSYATIFFKRPDGMDFNSKAIQFTIEFENKNGNRTPKNLIAKGNEQAIIEIPKSK